MSEPQTKPKSGWLNTLVDYGPLLVFLGVYKFYQPPETSTFGEIAAVIYGTIAFMIAAVVALAFSKWKFGKISPMLMPLSKASTGKAGSNCRAIGASTSLPWPRSTKCWCAR